MKGKIYILGAIVGFLVFALSMFFVESTSLLVISGMFGIWGMMYCIYNFFRVIMEKNDSLEK